MRVVEWINRKRDTASAILLVALSLLVAGMLGFLKLKTLASWGYTSDLFTFDTILQETLRGNIGLEFTYGNTFGDHAEPFLILLLPLKLLFQSHMPNVLLLIGPLTFFMASLILFFALRCRVGTPKAFAYAASYILGFSLLVRGLYEVIYGFHPDTFSGFVAAAFTSFLIWSQVLHAKGQKNKLQLAGFWLFFVAFLSLKEEMALLACLYFFIACILLRNRLNFLALILAVLAFVAEYCTILVFQTPYNRSNTALFSTVVEGVRSNGLRFFIQNPTGSGQQVVTYWSAIVICVLAFALALFLARKRDVYAVSLFLAGLAKVLLSISASDFGLYTWHNFPGFVMLISAILWQLSNLEQPTYLSRWVIPVSLLLASGVGLARWEIPYALRIFQTANRNMQDVPVLNAELERIKPFVPLDRIVAIPVYSAVRWAGYRYSFYPRGLGWSPAGIADYIVFPKNVPTTYTGGWENTYPLEKFQDDFIAVAETEHFRLYRRISIREPDSSSRQRFQGLFGLPPPGN